MQCRPIRAARDQRNGRKCPRSDSRRTPYTQELTRTSIRSALGQDRQSEALEPPHRNALIVGAPPRQALPRPITGEKTVAQKGKEIRTARQPAEEEEVRAAPRIARLLQCGLDCTTHGQTITSISTCSTCGWVRPEFDRRPSGRRHCQCWVFDERRQRMSGRSSFMPAANEVGRLI